MGPAGGDRTRLCLRVWSPSPRPLSLVPVAGPQRCRSPSPAPPGPSPIVAPTPTPPSTAYPHRNPLRYYQNPVVVVEGIFAKDETEGKGSGGGLFISIFFFFLCLVSYPHLFRTRQQLNKYYKEEAAAAAAAKKKIKETKGEEEGQWSYQISDSVVRSDFDFFKYICRRLFFLSFFLSLIDRGRNEMEEEAFDIQFRSSLRTIGRDGGRTPWNATPISNLFHSESWIEMNSEICVAGGRILSLQSNACD